jgi:hypothetical protein
MNIELLYVAECPNAAPTREMVRRCLDQLGLTAEIEEHEGDHPTPTVRVNGADVMGEHAATDAACRLDLPTEREVLAALRAATS